MLQGLMVVCGTGTLATSLAGCGSASESPQKIIASSGGEFTDAHRVFLTQLSDILIPQTDTPGAVIAGAAQKVELVLSDMLPDDERAKWLNGLDEIHTVLDTRVGGNFLKASQANQTNAVKKLDRAAYAENSTAPKAYRTIKKALATAYYYSEPGATEELRYDPVPGDWRACVPFSEIGRTWAT
ncbi:MAG: hypothetical protein COA69_11330 [Robiginitomaculum sp.]|nr:MAG: hypothetical protein COA69_11330 [Robiginitomaculum sp.]